MQETALLFENKSQDFYDKIILVTAPEEIRVKRVMNRDNSSEGEVLTRIKNQLEDAVKVKLSDYIIENIALEETKAKVIELNKALLEYC